MGNHVRFAVAHSARALGWAMVDLLLAWHLHAVIGLSGWAVSILMTVFLATGALANFAVGYWLTVRNAGGALYVRLQLVGAMVTALALAVQFLARDAAVVATVGIVFRIAFAMQDVPQNALGSLLPVGEGDAMRYARLRVMLSGAMRVVAIALHLMLLQIDLWTADMIAFAGVGGLIVASAVGLRGLSFPARPQRHGGRIIARSPWPRGLPRLLLGFAIASAVLPTLNRLLIFSPAIDDQAPHLGSWMLAAFCIGSIAGPLVHRRITLHFGEVSVLPVGVAVVFVSAVIATFADILVLRGLATVIHGIGLSIIGVYLWSRAAAVAMADSVSGSRRDGMVASAVILTTHLSMAVGALLLAPLIDTYETGDPGAAMIALLLVGAGALAIIALGDGRRGSMVAA